MKHLFSLAAALTFSICGIAAAQTTPPVSSPVVQPQATAPAAPVSAMPKSAATPTKAELKDGTKIEIGTDSQVYVLNADGTRTGAPDGTLTLRDSSSLVVKDGKKTDE